MHALVRMTLLSRVRLLGVRALADGRLVAHYLLGAMGSGRLLHLSLVEAMATLLLLVLVWVLLFLDGLVKNQLGVARWSHRGVLRLVGLVHLFEGEWS